MGLHTWENRHTVVTLDDAGSDSTISYTDYTYEELFGSDVSFGDIMKYIVIIPAIQDDNAVSAGYSIKITNKTAIGFRVQVNTTDSANTGFYGLWCALNVARLYED